MLGNRSGKMIIIIAVVVLLLAGVGTFVLKSKGKGKKTEVKLPTVEMVLGEFVVNLADSGSMRYLKTAIVLDVEGTVKSEGHGEAAGGDPKVRDAVIEVLSSKRISDLTAPGGKQKLREEIMAAVNKRLEGAKAVDVYFNDFAMQ